MAFCRNCGKQIGDNVSFCPACGTATGFSSAKNNTYPQEQIQSNQFQQNQFQSNQMYLNTSVPGRGLGIAGMIVGIVSLVFAFYMIIAIFQMLSSSFLARVFADNFIPLIIFFLIVSIVALFLGSFAKSSGYVCGVSSSAVIMGLISFCVYVISIFICLII